MIVTNMPYSWALIRRIFHLKSFFGDSDTVRDISLNGVSIQGESNATAQSVQKASRSSKFFPGRKGGKNSITAPKSSHDSDMQMASKTSWRPDENDANTAEESLGGSSGGSLRKPPVSSTSAALDKLYALDDDDLDAIETKEHERANRGRLYSGGE